MSRLPTDPREQLIVMQAALPEIGRHYHGSAIFAPSPDVFAHTIGKSKAMLYYFGTSYAGKLEAITGLKVVHTGIVLGDAENIDQEFSLPVIESPVVDELANKIDSLPQAIRQQLLARLALETTETQS